MTHDLFFDFGSPYDLAFNPVVHSGDHTGDLTLQNSVDTADLQTKVKSADFELFFDEVVQPQQGSRDFDGAASTVVYHNGDTVVTEFYDGLLAQVIATAVEVEAGLLLTVEADHGTETLAFGLLAERWDLDLVSGAPETEIGA